MGGLKTCLPAPRVNDHWKACLLAPTVGCWARIQSNHMRICWPSSSIHYIAHNPRRWQYSWEVCETLLYLVGAWSLESWLMKGLLRAWAGCGDGLQDVVPPGKFKVASDGLFKSILNLEGLGRKEYWKEHSFKAKGGRPGLLEFTSQRKWPHLCFREWFWSLAGVGGGGEILESSIKVRF